jgi:hypothetical protein
MQAGQAVGSRQSAISVKLPHEELAGRLLRSVLSQTVRVQVPGKAGAVVSTEKEPGMAAKAKHIVTHNVYYVK